MIRKIAVIGTGAGYTGKKDPPAPIAEIAGPGFEPELVEARLRSRSHTPYDRGMTAIGYLDCAIRAQQAGYEAAFINTFGDYGIDEMKSALHIPVVGAGEATMSMACNLGRQFSIVTIWPPAKNFLYTERLRNCSMEHRCASLRNVLTDEEAQQTAGGDETVARMRGGDETIIDRILKEIHRAIQEDGADTIVLGCTCMAPIGPVLAERSPTPVLEAMRTGYKMAETILDLGVMQSRVAYPKTEPANLKVLDALIAGQGDMEIDGDCQICVVVDRAGATRG